MKKNSPHFSTKIIPALLFCFIFLSFNLSCSSTPLPKNNDSVIIPEDFLGIVHAGKSGKPEEYDLLNTIGISWVLNTFYWNSIEKEKGVFDFTSYDNFVNTAKANGKKVIGVLGYQANWLYPDGKSKKYISPENIPLFLHYIEETVNHFRGRVDAWEIWNEPNFMFWKGSDKEFFELSRLAAQKIRETDPSSYILGGAFWRTPASFIKGMSKAGAMENLDALAFHPYAVNPGRSMKIHDNFLNVLEKINYAGPVWITENGFPTGGWYPTSVSPEEFPSYVIKTITGAAIRGTKVFLWYEMFDSYNETEVPPDASDSEHFFGLFYPDFTPKKGAVAYELLARFLPGSRYSPEFPFRDNIPSNIISFCFMNGNSGSNALILWNDKSMSKKINFSLPASSFLYDVSNDISRPLSGETVLEVGNQPLIISWQGTDIPRLWIPR